MIKSVLRFLTSTTMFQTLFNKNVRNLSISIGSIVAAFAVSHGAQNGTSTDLSNAVAGVVVALIGWGWSLLDAWIVEDKIVVAQKTGAGSEAAAEIKASAAQAAADSAQAAKTTAAVSEALKEAPKTDAEVDARLKDHSL